MSEYQYFEFQAIDRPLTDSEMRELRRYSSRATITPTSFVNVYNWGDFKGDRRAWLEKYFDAFLYVANWGTHRLEFRLPKRLLDPETVSAYCTEESLACYAKSDFVIVAFDSEDESGEWAEGEGWLASLAPLRTDLMNGDLRCLYLGWLAGVQGNWVCEEGCDKDESEPLVPPGLGALSSPLQSLADFLRIDPDWIAAAAEDSGEAHAMALTHDEIASWVARMPPEKKDAVLMALIDGSDMHSATELRQRAVREIRNARSTDSSGRLKRNGRSIDDPRGPRRRHRARATGTGGKDPCPREGQARTGGRRGAQETHRIACRQGGQPLAQGSQTHCYSATKALRRGSLTP